MVEKAEHDEYVMARMKKVMATTERDDTRMNGIIMLRWCMM